VNLKAVDQIARAVLYEGYMLYPYRPSSVKNQQRWNFGVLCPQSYSQAQNGAEILDHANGMPGRKQFDDRPGSASAVSSTGCTLRR